MFKAPVHHIGHLLATAGRINKLAEITQLKHTIELIRCINVSKNPEFEWNRFLRNAYLALNRLPEDDVEAHHIKNMLTKAVDMFNNEIPFHPLEASTTMQICDKLEDWEADVLTGKVHADDALARFSPEETTAQNALRLKFRLDVSREIGLVPMQELQRVLASLPFDIEITTPISRATLFDKPVKIVYVGAKRTSASGALDFDRIQCTFTFDQPITPLARDLIKERMLERKIGGGFHWEEDSLIVTCTCSSKDEVGTALKWRNTVEDELGEVLRSLNTTSDGFIR
ncbi:hypothetical protein BIZ83_gp152 [Erwinia phage vB_EamM_ChrisDB]|uniref:hypothetical protein n=1 Tax=Erwinia phage vB_EamM_ChrisDB TaxID=1883371 RepID=UPI00081CD007|nr:hypothetical protein BIZ83_gp152 [Erwinia phage vB_EamM_ChrisDB]ANZ48701.1 hypothetical protein CHRISDB_139 [Erwinia phage vB_EamM_ChrisDB]